MLKSAESRARLIVIFGYLGATLSGFLRQAALAQQLGASRAADIFLVAYSIPEFFSIALPIILVPAVLPIFVDIRAKKGESAAWNFIVSLTGSLLALLILFTIAAHLTAPIYIAWLSPGFSTLDRSQAIQNIQWMLPALAFMGLSTLAGTVLQIYRSFNRPALSTAIYNLIFILVLLAFPFGLPLDRAAWAVTAGSVASFLFQLPLLKKYWPSGLKMSSLFESLAVKQAALLAGPLTIGYGAHHLILFIDRAMATNLGAGIAASISYADRLTLVIGQLSGLSVATVLFPQLAEDISQGNFETARRRLGDSLRMVGMIAIPASAGLILLRTSVVHFLFERGAFDHNAALIVSNLLVWYTFGNLADAFSQPLWRVIYAQRTVWFVFVVNSIQTIIRLAANLVLIHYWGYIGLSVSAFLGLLIQAVILAWLVKRSLGGFMYAGWWKDALRIFGATAIAVLLVGFFSFRSTSTLSFGALMGLGILGGVAYLILLLLPGQIQAQITTRKAKL